jgi:hypothetical protein
VSYFQVYVFENICDYVFVYITYMNFVQSAFLFRLVERGIFCTSYIVDFEFVVVGLL